MKKIISMLLVLAMAICMVACSNQTETPNSTEGNKVNTNIIQKEDPAQDDTLNILMIGNSFCYYFTDELYGMAQAAGIKVRVSNIYYSGCTLEQHWNWWKTGEAKYTFITSNEIGQVESIDGTTLEYCLKQANWDIISLQEASGRQRIGSAAEVLATNKTFRTDIYNYLKEQFPKSQLYWHQTWAYQVGYDDNGYKMADAAQQTQVAELIRDIAIGICEENGVKRIPSGAAWQIVRDGGYDNLCARLAIKQGLGDFLHDGDIGGGQYLNACVWFEVLFGKSCVGNTFRPKYALSEDLIATLQQAAHQAVAAMNAQ